MQSHGDGTVSNAHVYAQYTHWLQEADAALRAARTEAASWQALYETTKFEADECVKALNALKVESERINTESNNTIHRLQAKLQIYEESWQPLETTQRDHLLGQTQQQLEDADLQLLRQIGSSMPVEAERQSAPLHSVESLLNEPGHHLQEGEQPHAQDLSHFSVLIPSGLGGGHISYSLDDLNDRVSMATNFDLSKDLTQQQSLVHESDSKILQEKANSQEHLHQGGSSDVSQHHFESTLPPQSFNHNMDVGHLASLQVVLPQARHGFHRRQPSFSDNITLPYRQIPNLPPLQIDCDEMDELMQHQVSPSSAHASALDYPSPREPFPSPKEPFNFNSFQDQGLAEVLGRTSFAQKLHLLHLQRQQELHERQLNEHDQQGSHLPPHPSLAGTKRNSPKQEQHMSPSFPSTPSRVHLTSSSPLSQLPSNPLDDSQVQAFAPYLQSRATSMTDDSQYVQFGDSTCGPSGELASVSECQKLSQAQNVNLPGRLLPQHQLLLQQLQDHIQKAQNFHQQQAQGIYQSNPLPTSQGSPQVEELITPRSLPPKRKRKKAAQTDLTSGSLLADVDNPAPKREKNPNGTRVCTFESCSQRPSYGFPGDKKPTYCRRHMLVGMADLVHPKCQEKGCEKGPTYGHPGDRQPSRCKAHKGPGMEDIKHRRCIVEGCKVTPSYGFPGGTPTHCRKHMVDGQEDVSHPRCTYEGCKIAPTYGYKKDKRASRCRTHMQEGMRDLKNVKCSFPGCGVTPSYGFLAEKRPAMCRAHMLTGMLNVRGASCHHEGCKNLPSYGSSDQRRPSRCHDHRLPDQVDFACASCDVPGCHNIPIYRSVNNRRPNKCERHRQEGMLPLRRCQHPGCKRDPTWGFPGDGLPSRCGAHYLPNMEDRGRPTRQVDSASQHNGNVEVTPRDMAELNASFGMPSGSSGLDQAGMFDRDIAEGALRIGADVM